MQFYFSHYSDALGYDNEDFLSGLLLDLYDAETFTMRKFSYQRLILPATFNTTSLTPVAVTGSNFNFVFTYPNAIIRLFDATIVNSTSQSSFARADISGIVPAAQADAEMIGGTQRVMVAIARYANLAVGISRTIRALLYASGGQASMLAQTTLLYEIEEWE